MERIRKDLDQGMLSQTYLLYGPEGYLRRQYRDKLKTALADGELSMNYHYFEGEGIVPEEIIDLAETLPFFAESRLIVIENSGWFKKGGEKMADYLKEPAPTVRFVFVEAEVDQRCRLFKSIKEHGKTGEFKVQDEKTLKKWILAMLKKEGLQITEAAMDLLLSKTGTDMENIRTEVEKLICYCMEKGSASLEDIEAVCTRQLSSHIFEMVEAIASRDQKKALELYYDLLALKEPALKILVLIGRQFHLLLQVKELQAKGYSRQQIADKTGLKPYVAGKYCAQTGHFGMEDLRKAVEACVEADEAVKTGKMKEILSVELLIISCASGKNTFGPGKETG